MMLDEIVRRQKEFAEKLQREREKAAKAPAKAKKEKKVTKEAAPPQEAPVATTSADSATPASSTPTKELKMIGVPTPIELHERMERVLAKVKGVAGGPTSKKDLMVRALMRYLDEFEQAEGLYEILNNSPKPVPEALRSAIKAAKSLNTDRPGDVEARMLHEKLEKAGYRDFFVGVGDGELVVYHGPNVFIGSDALPKTFEGYLVRAKATTLVPVGDVVGVKR